MSQPDLRDEVSRCCALSLALAQEVATGDLLSLGVLLETRQQCLDNVALLGKLTDDEIHALYTSQALINAQLAEAKSVLLSELKQVGDGVSVLTAYTSPGELRSYDAAG